MTQYRRFLPALAVLLLLGACSSSHRLHQYDFHNKRVVFRSTAECRDMNASVWIDDPVPEATPWTAVASLFVSLVGSAAADANVKDVVSTQGVAELLATGMQRSMEDRFNITAQHDGDGEADFIVDTRLKGVALVSNADGVFLRLDVEQSMLDWKTRDRIWRMRFDEHVPLRSHSTGIWDPTVMAVEGVISAVELFKMGDAEIQDAVLATARDAGWILADRFVRDAS